nr:hypothetical protein CFP56_60505 [Quercus suber]
MFQLYITSLLTHIRKTKLRSNETNPSYIRFCKSFTSIRHQKYKANSRQNLQKWILCPNWEWPPISNAENPKPPIFRQIRKSFEHAS